MAEQSGQELKYSTEGPPEELAEELKKEFDQPLGEFLEALSEEPDEPPGEPPEGTTGELVKDLREEHLVRVAVQQLLLEELEPRPRPMPG